MSDALKAALSGRYRIESEIGSGGMATVYLAQDLKHDRKVAVKVLKPELAAVLGADRFLSEIKTTANLQHPHILPLFDSDEADGFLFFVTPYVEGETLRGRIDREKQLSVDDAVGIAQSVANALDYAHRHGVIHRDIKPENILLRDGQPMVADFGISLAVSAAGGERLTETGLSLGTPHYMSPEQASGDREVDGRSDLYSLACVLYEMLAGDPPHTGSTVQAVIASTLSSDPEPITTRRRTVATRVASALHRALEKVPADRFDTAADFAGALGEKGAGLVPSVTLEPSAGGRVPRLAMWLAVALLALLLVIQILPGSREVRQPMVTSISPPPGHRFMSQVSFALSPDGTQIAFVALSDEGNRQLWIRPLDSLYAFPLTEVDGEGWPFWSPDSEALGFFAHGAVWTVDPDGGARNLLCQAVGFRGGAWSAQESIVFAAEGGIWRTAATGGGCDLLIPDTLGSDVVRPSFLPDDRRFLYTRTIGRTLELGDLGTGATRIMASWDSMPSGAAQIASVQFARPDYLVLGAHQPGASGEELPLLRGSRINLSNLSVHGEPVEIVRPVRAAAGIHSYSISNTGLLAYLPEQPNLPPVVFDREGTPLPTQIEGIPGRWTFGVAQTTSWLFLGGDADIWKYDYSTGVASKAFTGPAFSPEPGPGDSLVAYLYWRARDDCAIRVFNADPDRSSELFSGRCLRITDWSADGEHLLMENSLAWLPNSSPTIRIWRYSFRDDSVSEFVVGDGDVRDGTISPDAHWVAFSSDETGAPEVYVRRFEARDRGVRISRSGGRWPQWAADSRGIYFLSPDGGVFEADLEGVVAGRTPAEPNLLFQHPMGQRIAFTDAGTGFGATSDGQTFFLRPRTEDQNIALVQNWPALMNRR